MDSETEGKGLDATDFTQQRNVDIQSAVTGLLAINGGGAVALLAFYQAVYTEQHSLAETTLYSMIFLVSGAAVASLVHMFRFHASFAFQGSHDKSLCECARRKQKNLSEIYRWCYIGCAYLSLILFIVGMWVIINGAFQRPA